MSNKQSLCFESIVHTLFFFTILNIFFTFSSQGLFWCLEYSVLARSLMRLIDKSSQFCNTGNKYEEAITTCAFGRRLGMSTISVVPICAANMHACNSAQVYGLKVFNLVIGRNMQPTVFTCVS